MANIGEIRMFAGTYAPTGWALCDGSLLQIGDYPELAGYLGKTYGGDGMNTFGLPDLGANAPIHRSDAYALGATGTNPLGVVAQPQPFLYIIALTTPPYDAPDPYVGEIRTFAFGSSLSRNWAPCDGSILTIANENEMLFSIIGNRYGGNSEQETFALPDLRANMTAPAASTDPLGYVVTNYCIATLGVFPPPSS